MKKIKKLIFTNHNLDHGFNIGVGTQEHDFLGSIDYYKPWKSWVWEQGNLIMSEDDLKQVVDKLHILNSKTMICRDCIHLKVDVDSYRCGHPNYLYSCVAAIEDNKCKGKKKK